MPPLNDGLKQTNNGAPAGRWTSPSPISCLMASVFSTWNIILRKVICFWCVLMDVCDYACMFVRVHMCMQVHRHTRTCMSQGQRSTLGVLPQKSPVVFPKAELPISLSPAKLTGLAAQSVPGGSPYICPSGLPFLNKGSGD